MLSLSTAERWVAAAAAVLLVVGVAALLNLEPPALAQVDAPGDVTQAGEPGPDGGPARAVLGVDPTTASAEVPPEVGAADFLFGPGHLVIESGVTVTWTITGEVPHSITATDGSFNSGTLGPGERYQRTFDHPGMYAYVCAFHPQMIGLVEVRGEAPASTDEVDGAFDAGWGGATVGEVSGVGLGGKRLMEGLLFAQFVGAVTFEVWRHRSRQPSS